MVFTDAELYELMMELGLSKVILPCATCSDYIRAREAVFVPEILKISKRTNESPTDIFVRFRNRYHEHHTNEHPANT